MILWQQTYLCYFHRVKFYHLHSIKKKRKKMTFINKFNVINNSFNKDIKRSCIDVWFVRSGCCMQSCSKRTLGISLMPIYFKYWCIACQSQAPRPQSTTKGIVILFMTIDSWSSNQDNTCYKSENYFVHVWNLTVETVCVWLGKLGVLAVDCVQILYWVIRTALKWG